MSINRQQRCWAEIDLAAFERNLKGIQAALPAKMRYVAVVKADAYGHGMPQIVRRLMQSGVDAFAVANIKEAADIRHMGVGWPILILSPVLPEEAARLIEDDLTPTISTQAEANWLNELARQKRAQLKVHLKIDTGMGRLGVWHEQATELLHTIQQLPHLKLEGIYTHFSSADSEPSFTRLQRERLLRVLETIPKEGLLIHADNSASLRSLSGTNPFNAVRIGLLQFGVPPYPQSALGHVPVEPVFSFYTRVGLIKDLPAATDISYGRTHQLARDSRIAVLTAGYADGIPLALSNTGAVLIHGQRCPILGRVTMDQTIVDITPLVNVEPGETAVLIGSSGAEEITVTEFSQTAGSIPWESLCSITKRVTRVYVGSREI
jgi:alanine racemase